MKVLIVHDRFQFKGGAERLILILAEALKADLMTEFWTSESFEVPKEFYLPQPPPYKGGELKALPLAKGEVWRESVTQKLFILDQAEAPQIVWRYFRAHFNFIFKTRKIIRQYDTVIFSGNNCLSAAINCRRGTKKIFYCHSPVRHVFDLWKLNRSEQKKAWKKIIYYNIGAHFIKFIYWLGLKMMNVTIANSENIKNRLWKFSHQKTDLVIYPPIEKFISCHPEPRKCGVKDLVANQHDQYYLSYGRLERLKRIPDIISAFQKMPDKKLVVVSGGPDLEKVRQMAIGYDNIKIIGWVSDEELKNYLGNCLATIYIPIDEDFGMSPVESMAAGKPCLGVAEGGLLETIIDEKTGKFVPAKYSIDDLVEAVNWLTPERALSMRADCEAQAQKFSKEKFIERMKEIVKNERKIKISIDASRSIDSIQKTGVEKVSDELLTELKTQLAKHKEIEPVFYTPKQISWLPKESQRILRWPPKLLWTQIRLSWELVWRRPNIFFAPVHALPWVLLLCHPVLDTGSRKTDLDSGSEAGMTNKKIRVYKILHDIAFKRNPGFYSWQQKLILNFDLWLASLVCAKIFVPTQAVKDDILKYFPKINTEKIVVIHHGYNPVCHSEAESRRIPALPAGRPSPSKNTEGSFANAQDDKKIKKQILYIGRVEEKKNISNLIKAFEIFSQKKSDYKLILAGKIDSNFITSYGLQVTGYKNIEFLGYITEQKKQELLQESSCLVLISQAEGFGFTILEGFDFGLPVLASDIPVLKEIGGDACLFVNPENPEKIAAGLEKITSDESLRQNLRERGREQLKKFSWQIAAEKYLLVLSQNE